MLSTSQRKEYFKYLGLGEYNSANILKVQKEYFKRKSDQDGKYGSNTDKLIVNLFRVKKYAPHFKITEFKCHCDGKYCTGYPAYLSVTFLTVLEAIRNKFGVTHVSSGERCKTWNSKQTGSASQSKHIEGKAADIYGDYTKTAAGREKLKKFIYSLPGVNYVYYGTANMGKCVHFDTKK